MTVQVFEYQAGRLGPAEAAPDLAATSLALPGGAYTTLRTFGGRRFLRLADHVRRLSDSAGAPVGSAAVRDAIRQALAACRFRESRLRLTWAPPRLFVAVEEFMPPAPALYEEGVRCATVPLQRQNPQAKDSRFIATAEQAYRQLPPGTYEGLLVAEDGSILEGLSSNFFAIVGGALRTEGARALPGITRSLVLEEARALMAVEEVALRTAELPAADEAFITSASRGVVPVVAVDAAAIGDGRPGRLTAALRRRYEERVAREVEEP